MTLSGETNATIVDGTAAVVIGASSAPPIATPAVSAPVDMVVGEADGYVDLPVRLSAPGQNAVSVDYGTSPSSAVCRRPAAATSDYATTSGTLNFAPGDDDQGRPRASCSTAPTPAKGSSRSRLDLSAAVNATIARSSALVSIVNNDSVAATPRLHVRDAVVDEKDGSVRVPGAPRRPDRPGLQQHRDRQLLDERRHGHRRQRLHGHHQRACSASRRGRRSRTSSSRSSTTARRPRRASRVSLSNPVNATISDGTGTVVIGASAAIPVASPSVSAPPDVIVGEGDGYVDLPVRLSAPGTNPVSVVYTTTSSTASDGQQLHLRLRRRRQPGADAELRTRTDDEGRAHPAARLHRRRGHDLVLARRSARRSAARSREPSTLVSIVNDSNIVQTPPRIHVRDAVVDEKDGSVLVPVLLGGAERPGIRQPVKVDYATEQRHGHRRRRLPRGPRHAHVRARPDGEEHRRADLRHRPQSRPGASRSP